MRTLIFFVASSLIALSVSAQNVPKPLSNPDPTYPKEAGELGYGGTVQVVVQVDKKGQVKIVQAFGPNAPCANKDEAKIKKIRKAVTDAASQVVFEPFIKDGKASELEVALSYSFDAAGKPLKPDDKGRIMDAGVLKG